MGCDIRTREKVDATQVKMIRGREQKIKNLVELPDADKNYLVKKEIVEAIKLIPEENQIEPTKDENISITGEQDEEDIEANDIVDIKSEVISDWKDNDEYCKNLCIPFLRNPTYHGV
jgi:hypothetical protein